VSCPDSDQGVSIDENRILRFLSRHSNKILAGIVLGCRGKLFDIFLEEVELLAKQQASSLLGDLTCLVAFIEGDFVLVMS